MLGYIAAWIWWVTWRVVVTLAATLTIQHVIHEEDGVWIETKPLLVGAALLVLCIRIWSMAGHRKESKCQSSTGSSGFSAPME